MIFVESFQNALDCKIWCGLLRAENAKFQGFRLKRNRNGDNRDFLFPRWTNSNFIISLFFNLQSKKMWFRRAGLKGNHPTPFLSFFAELTRKRHLRPSLADFNEWLPYPDSKEKTKRIEGCLQTPVVSEKFTRGKLHIGKQMAISSDRKWEEASFPQGGRFR